MSDYQPVPFPFDDPSNPDVAVETPLWKGGPRPQWEVAGQPDPNAVGKATNDFLLNGKPLSLAASRQTLDDDHYTYARIGGGLWRFDPRHPISPSCVCTDPEKCRADNWCRLSDKKSLGVDTGPIPVLWNSDLIDAVRQSIDMRNSWISGEWIAEPDPWYRRIRRRILHWLAGWADSISAYSEDFSVWLENKA